MEIPHEIHGHGEQAYSENRELRGSHRFEGHALPQPLNPPCEPIDAMFAPTCLTIIDPQLPIGFVAGEPMAGTAHDRVGHRQDGLFLPPTGANHIPKSKPDPTESNGLPDVRLILELRARDVPKTVLIIALVFW